MRTISLIILIIGIDQTGSTRNKDKPLSSRRKVMPSTSPTTTTTKTFAYSLRNTNDRKGDLPARHRPARHQCVSQSYGMNTNKTNDSPSHQRMNWVSAYNKCDFLMYKNNRFYTKDNTACPSFPYGSYDDLASNITTSAKPYSENDEGFRLPESSQKINSRTFKLRQQPYDAWHMHRFEKYRIGLAKGQNNMI